MAVELGPSRSSLIDVLDRVLDKGIVVDAWVRVSVAGIDLITVEARIVVASVATYLQYSETFMDVSAVPTRAAAGNATIFDGRVALPRRPRTRSTVRVRPGPPRPGPEL